MSEPDGKAASGILPYASVTTSAIVLGTSFVLTRFVMPETTPGMFGFLCFGISLLVLLPLSPLAFRHRRPSPRDLLGMLALGVIQFGMFYYFTNWALETIPASRGAVIFSMIPIMTALISALVGSERLTARVVGAAVLAVVGVSLAIGEKAFRDVDADWSGEFLFFLAVCCGGTYNSFAGRFLKRYSPLALTTVAVAGGTAFLGVFAWSEGGLSAWPTFSIGGWFAVAFLAIPRGAFGLMMFNYAVQKLSATRAAIFVPLAPVVATVLGYVWLDEPVSPLFLVGLGCVIAAIVIVNRRVGGRRRAPL